MIISDVEPVLRLVAENNFFVVSICLVVLDEGTIASLEINNKIWV